MISKLKNSSEEYPELLSDKIIERASKLSSANLCDSMLGLGFPFDGAIELGLPIFEKGFMQRGPAKKKPGEINYPIVCGDVPVNPGDLIVGDADGVTVIPKDKIEEVLT
jgi:hypothetical protein